MTYRWNFRATSAFVADAAPELFVPPTQGYVANTQPGWLGGTPISHDDNVAYGSRAAGYESLVNSTGRYFSAPVAPGSYKIDLCLGVEFANQRSAINIFDGYCGDTQNRNFAVWQTGAAFGPGTYCMHGPNLYARMSGGSVSGSTPPTHSAGDASDGTIVWRFVKSAVWSIDTGTPANRFVDATGTAHAPADWQANAQLSTQPLTLSAGFITVARRASVQNFLRHLGLVRQSPSNTGLPVITGTAVVGETLSVSTGSWSGSPTAFAYQWQRDGTAIAGATAPKYVIRDTDAGFGVAGITCTVTASNPGGSTTATTAVLPCRRTYPTLGYSFGRLTRRGLGGVSYNKIPGLYGATASQGVSWATSTASTGTDNHWDRNVGDGSITPVPKNHGTVVDPTYVFKVAIGFADGKPAEEIDVTVSTVAQAYSLSSRDHVGIFNSQVGPSALSGKTVLISTGSDFSADDFLFQCVATSTVKIRYADLDRPCLFRSFRIQNSANIQVGAPGEQGVLVGGTGASAIPAGAARFVINNAPNTSVYAPELVGDPALIRTSIANNPEGNQTSKHDFFSIVNSTNVLIEDAKGQYLNNYISCSPKSLSTFTSRRARIRDFYSNGILFGGGGILNSSDSHAGGSGQTCTSEDDIFIASHRIPRSTDHMDGIQMQDSALNSSLTVRRLMVIHANGTSACQGIWNGYNAVNDGTTNSFDIDGVIVMTRYGNGIGIGSGNAGTYKRLLLLKSSTGGYTLDDEASTNEAGVDKDNLYGPWFRADGDPSDYSGSHSLSRSVFEAGIFNNALPAGFTATDGVVSLDVNQHGRAPGTMPASTITGAYVGAFANANPKTAVAAIDFDILSVSAIGEAVRMALRPTDGGAFERSDGSFNGPLNPDGSWATDAPYLP